MGNDGTSCDHRHFAVMICCEFSEQNKGSSASFLSCYRHITLLATALFGNGFTSSKRLHVKYHSLFWLFLDTWGLPLAWFQTSITLNTSFSDQRVPLSYLVLHLQCLNSMSIKPKASSQSVCEIALYSAFDLKTIKLACFIHLLD